ncbi:ABC transporter permease [Streptomyces sp. NPDC058417]|uniref:ABC transporter permease n=1 Tax=unclassified Streptomyces TaxID=2593676 RepID=UPI003667E6B9
MTTVASLPPSGTAPDAPRPASGPRAPRAVAWLLGLHRPALWAWAAIVVLLTGAILVLWGPLGEAAVAARPELTMPDCGPGEVCGARVDFKPDQYYDEVYAWTNLAMIAVPFLVAAWAGAALVGRELESGTARLAWTLGISPTRWLTAKLALPAALITAGLGLLVLLHRFLWTARQGRTGASDRWSEGPTLYTNGPALPAFALAALAVGALAGVVCRRTLPALGLGLGVTLALGLATDRVLPYLWPRVTRVRALDEPYTYIDGIPVVRGLITESGARIADPGCGPSWQDPQCVALFDRVDVTGFYDTFHPQSHFWPLHLMAAALLLAVAAACVVTAYALIRRSTATPPRRHEAPAASGSPTAPIPTAT